MQIFLVIFIPSMILLLFQFGQVGELPSIIADQKHLTCNYFDQRIVNLDLNTAIQSWCYPPYLAQPAQIKLNLDQDTLVYME